MRLNCHYKELYIIGY